MVTRVVENLLQCLVKQPVSEHKDEDKINKYNKRNKLAVYNDKVSVEASDWTNEKQQPRRWGEGFLIMTSFTQLTS